MIDNPQRFRLLLLLVLGCALAIGLLGAPAATTAAPGFQVTNTSIPVTLPTREADVALTPTTTPTRTPTPAGPVMAEAREESGSNVRASADIESERLGVIYPGDLYEVLGRAAGTQWLQIQYPDSPTGRAWVFEEVVFLEGEVEDIPELNPNTEPTVNVAIVQEAQTAEVLRQTPGALETANALQGQSGLLLTPGFNATDATGPLPTFTFPPGITPGMAASQPTIAPPISGAAAAQDSGLAPIVPLLGLTGLGVLGLFVSFLRRAR